MANDLKHLGSSHAGAYDYYKKGNHVYQYRDDRCLGWMCSYTAWDNAIKKICDN